MKDQVALSMRSGKRTAREMMQEVATCGAKRIQLDALHPDFAGLSVSGRRDISATIRRNGLLASGVDFLLPQSAWEQDPESTLHRFTEAVAIAEVAGNVPVGTLLPEEGEIAKNAIQIGHGSGVLVSTHRNSTRQMTPLVGWNLPIVLLAKTDRPLKALAQASYGPMAVRVKGEVVGGVDSSTLEIAETRFELRELRGVLDAMRWSPTPIIDAMGDEAVKLIHAWHVAGPW